MSKTDSWFRMYNAVVDNPKVQSLKDALFRAWVNLLCVASQSGGKLPTYEDIAFKLRITTAKAKALVEDLEDRGLFDRDTEGRLFPHDWNELQFKSDTSTPRVKRFRSKERNVSETIINVDDETDHSRAEQSIDRTEPPKPPRGPVELPKDFQKFWDSYPDKVGQKAALKAWRNAKDKPDLRSILAALETYIRTKPSDRQWCAPSVWLNQGRWNDRPAGSTTAPVTIANDAVVWQLRIDAWQRSPKTWLKDQWGATPDSPDCKAPKGLLQNIPTPSERALMAG